MMFYISMYFNFFQGKGFPKATYTKDSFGVFWTNWVISPAFPNSQKVKVGVLRPVQQPGSYWDRSSELPLVGLEPTEVTAYD